MYIREDDLSDAQTQALLSLHLAAMHANSPPGHVFALDLSGLKSPSVTVWSAWGNSAILGICALRQIDGDTGELKSMRTHPDHLRKGVAAALLAHTITRAREKGLLWLSLETGSGAAFEPAIRLYRKCGFTDGAPFEDYTQSEFNRFLHLPLA